MAKRLEGLLFFPHFKKQNKRAFFLWGSQFWGWGVNEEVKVGSEKMEYVCVCTRVQ